MSWLRKKTGLLLILGSAVLATLVLLSFKIGFYHFIKGDIQLEIFLGIASLIGVLLGLLWPKRKTVVYGEKIPEIAWKGENNNSLLSSREMEILLLMASGLSNQEIADRLHVSLNTIKTHNNRIFQKLDVSRRTQAIHKAKALGLIREHVLPKGENNGPA